MKRKISLYIGDKPADLSTDSLVQMSYTAEDLSDPAIVKNSYSQQETLPATRNNDAIFGGIFRADRRTVSGDGSTGASFSPLVRTPFTIYDEAGELLESGYMKLDSITAKDGSPAYVITLYGGLGSFFYTLSYDDEGNEMTLGNLPLLADVGERVGFTINKEAVAAAWEALRAGTSGQWQVVNFAPAYNGVPDGDFNADKAVGKPSEVGGRDSTSVGEKIYQMINNNALFDLGEDFTEWQIKDLRSYLQRPVVSVKGLMEGISRFAAAKGFTLELDPEFFTSINPSYSDAWMTLSLLPTAERLGEEGNKVISGYGESEAVSSGAYFDGVVAKMSPANTLPDALVTVTVKPKIVFTTDPTDADTYLNVVRKIFGEIDSAAGIMVFEQLLLLDASGENVGASPIQVYTSGVWDENISASQWAGMTDLPMADRTYGANLVISDKMDTISTSITSNHYIPDVSLQELSASGVGVVQVIVKIWVRRVSYYKPQKVWLLSAFNGGIALAQWNTSGSIAMPNTIDVGVYSVSVADGNLEYKVSGYRSDSVITQKVLFSDTMTPAAFLLSYSKMFGLSYIYDKGTKTVRLVTRNTLYDGEVIDLQTRIDRSKEIKTIPMVTSTKWLSFSTGEAEGEFVEFYRDKYGREYSSQKVNTGYDFNADTKDVLESVEFKGGAEVLEKSTYFNNLTLNGKKIPSPFLNGKASYRLYSNGNVNDSTELEGLTPGGVDLRIEYFDKNMPSYDILPKLQCHSNDNSAADGNGILLFHRGFIADDSKIAAAYARFIITDDSSEMYTLNGGPCWELSKGKAAIDMPIFGRHFMDGSEVKYSMEFGVPAELDIPFVTVDADASVYARSWQKYIEDRYNIDTRVRSAYVDFRGIQVGEHLLRKFYFADNAIWALNKISNYSLTGAGTTQCEFVKVQDRKAYTEGQLVSKYYLTLNGTTSGDITIPSNAAARLIRVPYQTNGTLQLSSSGDAIDAIKSDIYAINIYTRTNPSSEPRTGTVTVTLKETSTIRRNIVIKQAGAMVYNPSVSFSEPLPWSAKGTPIAMTNNGNVDLEVITIPEWFLYTGVPHDLPQGEDFAFGIDQNTTVELRTGVIGMRYLNASTGQYVDYSVEVMQKSVSDRMVIIDASVDPSLKGKYALTDFELLDAKIHNTEMIDTQVDSDGIISLTFEQVAGYLNIPSLDDYEGDVLEVRLPDEGISGRSSVMIPGDIHIVLE